MDITHITLTAERRSRLPLFPDEATYCEALHRIGAIVGGCLALFALLTEHLHLVAALARAAAGRLAQRVLLALRPIVTTPLARSHFEDVNTRSYMRWLLRYALEQPRKHGMPGHPALWVGSCFPDLVGARVVSGLSLCLARVLPDYVEADALRIVGLPGSSVPLADRSTLRAAGCHRLKLAAAAAFGVDPSLKGKRPAAQIARRTLAQLAVRVGISRAEISFVLDRPRKTTSRLMKPEVESSELLTVARRVGLENLVRDAMAGHPRIERGDASPGENRGRNDHGSSEVTHHPARIVAETTTDRAR